jgi:hypothetical protein
MIFQPIGQTLGVTRSRPVNGYDSYDLRLVPVGSMSARDSAIMPRQVGRVG